MNAMCMFIEFFKKKKKEKHKLYCILITSLTLEIKE